VSPEPPRPLRAVLFDWDGTLVDSAEASYRCYARVFPLLGIPFDRSHFERTYSPDWYRTYRALGLPEEKWAEADALWLEHFGRECAVLLPGAAEALDELGRASLALGIVSSGERERVAREMAGLGLTRTFRAVVGGGDSAYRKPHPEPLQLALSRLSAAPDESVYVGDSPEDIEMGRAAGVYTVGIPGPFPNREALVASRPDLLADGLRQAVSRLLGTGGGSG